MKFLIPLLIALGCVGCSSDFSRPDVQHISRIGIECDRKVVSFAMAHSQPEVLTRPMTSGDIPEVMWADIYTSSNVNRYIITEFRCQK